MMLGGSILLIAGLGLAVLATSLVYNPARIRQSDFWIIVALKTLVMVLAFNITYFIITNSKKADETHPVRKTFKEYAAYIKAVYDQKLQQVVRNKIKEGNRKRFEEVATILLQRITATLEYKDLFSDGKPIDIDKKIYSIMEEYYLTKREVKHLKAIIISIINGRVSYPVLDYNEIMLDAEITKYRYAAMGYNEKKAVAFKNAYIVVSSIGMAALTTVLALGAINDNLWYEIFANIVTIAWAAFSALMFANGVLRKLKNVYQARKDFLSEFIEPAKEVDIGFGKTTIKLEPKIEPEMQVN